MQIIRVKKQGPCSGVLSAIIRAKQIAKKHQGQKIYCLGYIVHNRHVINELQELGIITLDDSHKTRYQLIAELENNTIVIFSSHGTPKNVFELAKQKNIMIYDTTCRYVYKTHEVVEEYLNKKYEVIFIGKKNHPETNSVLHLSEKIHFIEKKEEISSLSINGDEKFVMATNQTTLSTIDLEDIFNELKNKFKNIVIENEICYATQERQQALKDLKDESIDLVLVVGDKKSNNSLKLVEIANTICKNAYLIDNYSDIDFSWFKNINKLAVTSGASTPSYLVDKIISEIEANIS